MLSSHAIVLTSTYIMVIQSPKSKWTEPCKPNTLHRYTCCHIFNGCHDSIIYCDVVYSMVAMTVCYIVMSYIQRLTWKTIHDAFYRILCTSRHVRCAKYTAQSWRLWKSCEMDLSHNCSLHGGNLEVCDKYDNKHVSFTYSWAILYILWFFYISITRMYVINVLPNSPRTYYYIHVHNDVQSTRYLKLEDFQQYIQHQINTSIFTLIHNVSTYAFPLANNL